MPSNVDPLVPPAGNALTADVRANFAAAKTEIETLQTGKANAADLTAHETLTNNPHAVTAAQVGAATKSDMSLISVRRWFTRTSAADNSWSSVAWSPELGLFAAVSFSGTGNRVMTSPNGINWTIRTSAADNDWGSVAWSPALGLFAAVSFSGTGNRVMTSPDGINWTIRTSAADNDWGSVAWSPALGLFAAVSFSGTGNRVMTSPDGINWTIRTSAADNSWSSVAWSPALGLFAAV